MRNQPLASFATATCPARLSWVTHVTHVSRVTFVSLLALVMLVMAVYAPTPLLHAQCTTQWLPGFGSPYLQSGDEIRVLKAFDPDGDGPLGEHLFAAGKLVNIDGWPVRNAAIWNGTEWTSPWGTGNSALFGEVNAFAIFNGEFHVALSGSTPQIRRWNGTAWIALPGTITGGQVHCLEVHNGQLYVGGTFTGIAGVANTRSIARWDGNSYSAVGAGMDQPTTTIPVVYAMLSHQGSLWVGGAFARVSAVVTFDAARWNDATGWEALPGISDVSFDGVYTFLAHGSDVYAGGSIRRADGSNAPAARWAGSSWEILPGNLSQGPVRTLAYWQPQQRLIASGPLLQLTGIISGTNTTFLWDGVAWTAALETTDPTLFSGGGLTSVLYQGRLVFGGIFSYQRGSDLNRIGLITWDGVRWSTLCRGIDYIGGEFVEFEGDLVLAGTFRVGGGGRANGVVRWNGERLDTMGYGVISTSINAAGSQFAAFAAQVYNGRLFLAGSFYNSEIVSRWNEATSRWEQTHADIRQRPTGGQMLDMTVYNNELYVIGLRPIIYSLPTTNDNRIVKFNGTSWSNVVSGQLYSDYKNLATHNGELYAADHQIYRLPMGGVWTPVQSYVGGEVLEILDRGDDMLLLTTGAAGPVGAGSCVLRYANGAFEPLGGGIRNVDYSGSLSGELLMYHGDVIATKWFVVSNPDRDCVVARYNGIRWEPLPDGPAGVMDGRPTSPRAGAMIEHEGVLWITGTFATAGGRPSPMIARYVASPPPVITLQPVAAVSCAGRGARFSIALENSAGVEFRWRRNKVLLDEGPIAGGNGTASGTATPTLNLDGLSVADAAMFDCIATTQCGTSYSVQAALVVDASCCDGIDFNHDGVFPDSLDIDDYLSVFGGGACSTDPIPGCGDIDFNNDGVFPDSADIDALLRVFGGGAC